MTDEESNTFKKFLMEFKEAFADPTQPLERAKFGEHCINLKNESPIKEITRQVLIFKREKIDNEVKNLEKQGLIEK